MTWKKVIKQAELIPFPPGSGEEESWMFPYDIKERFVESPRGRRGLSSVNAKTEDEHFYDLVLEHGHGINDFEGLNFDEPGIMQKRHNYIHQSISPAE